MLIYTFLLASFNDDKEDSAKYSLPSTMISTGNLLSLFEPALCLKPLLPTPGPMCITYTIIEAFKDVSITCL